MCCSVLLLYFSALAGQSLFLYDSLQIVSILHRSNIIVFVGGGSYAKFPSNTVMVWDDKQQELVLEVSILYINYLFAVLHYISFFDWATYSERGVCAADLIFVFSVWLVIGKVPGWWSPLQWTRGGGVVKSFVGSDPALR